MDARWRRIGAVFVWVLVATSLQAKPGPALSLDLCVSAPPPDKPIRGATMVACLYAYNPRLADVASTEVSRVTLQGLTLSAQGDTIVRFPITGTRENGFAYYVTVFIHPDSTRTQRLYFIDGFQRVLEHADNETIAIRLTRGQATGQPD